MSNDIATRDFAGEMTSGNLGVWTSFDADTEDGKIKLYSVTSDSKKVSEILDQYINIKDVVIENVEIANEETGIVDVAPRITFITDKGDAYSCVSDVILRDLKRIFNYFGFPTDWDKPKKMKFVEGRSNKGRHFFTLKF